MPFPSENRFNPDDADTKEFLTGLGLSSRSVGTGEISDADLERGGIDLLALLEFLEIAVFPEGPEFSARLFENLDNGFLEFDETAVTYAAGFLRDNDSPLLRSLLRYGACPDGETAVIILENLYADSAAFYSDRPDGVTPEAACPLPGLVDRGFMAGDLEGVAFNDLSVGEFWREIGKAVIPISIWDGEGGEYAGSAVVVSPEGHVMTAAHNVIRPDGETFADSALRFGDEEFPIFPEDVLYVDAAADVAVLRIPGLGRVPGLSYAKIAEARPEEAEDVTVIGYPLTVGADPAEGEFPRAYALGRYYYPVRDDLRSDEDGTWPLVSREGIYHLTMARPFPGDSGGGFFNSRGELIGITSNIETVVNRSEAASVLLEDAEDPLYEGILREIRAAARSSRS